MAENFDLKVTIEAQYGDIIAQQTRLNRLLDSGEISTEQFGKAQEALSRNLLNTSRAEANAATATERYARAQNTADKATRSTNQGVGDLGGNLPRLRYALYDVATSLGVTGAALTAAAAGAYGVNIAFDRAFADVQRTTYGAVDGVNVFQSEVDGLRAELVGLSTELPVAFTEIARIASLAGQLNVPTEAITEFTNLVAQFGATTDVSVDAAAEAFGRLSELLNVPDSELQNLGSSILQVGTNAVATESDIIAISTQIAGIANQAGLTADEVFGLSAALASVGIQPELARGTITRLFGNIDRAVAAGGQSLEDFGAISNRSGADFAAGWSSAPTEELLRFFDGLANREGPAAEAALRAIGITSVRDVPAILRLAQTTDTILRPALEQAAEGYANGTELSEQYGIVAETVASKLTTLANNFQALLDALGQSSAAFGPILDLGNQFLQVLTELAQNPVGSAIASIGIAVAGLAGVLTLLLAGLTLSTGALLAARTAIAEATGGTGRLSDAFRILTGAILGTNGALAANTAATRTNAGVTNTAAASAGRLSSILGKAGLIGSLLALAPALYEIGTQVDGMILSMQGLTKETEEYATLIQNGQLFDQLNGLLGKTGQNNAGFDLGAVGISGQGLLSVSGGNLDSIYGFLDQLSGLSSLTEVEAELQKIDTAIAQLATTNLPLATSQFAELRARLEEAGYDGDVINRIFDETTGALSDTGIAADQANSDFEAMSAAVQEAYNSFFDVVDAELAVEGALYDLGSALGQGGNDWSIYSEAGRANIEAVMAAADALAAQTPGDAAATAASLQGLFNSIVAGGYASAAQLAFLSNTIAALNSQAKGAGQAVAAPRAIDLSSLSRGFDSGRKAATKAAGAARKVREEVVTLVDYANDLEKVFSRAFDIQFGTQKSLDSIASAWMDIADENQDARDEIQGYRDDISDLRLEIQGLNADIKALSADRNVASYFLDVANAYGDQLRAGVLRGDIAEIDAELAEKQNDLKKAQDATNKAQSSLTKTQQNLTRSTEGNSRESIANRAALNGLVDEYKDYIIQLAESGADQATLTAAVDRAEQEFYAQARSLGFTDSAARTAAAGFDTLRTAIANVPRNITVSANTNPARQALNEFLAQVRNSRADAQVGGGGAGAAGTQAGRDFKNAFDQVLKTRTHQWEIQQTLPNGVRSTIGGLTFASGGYVSGAGTSTSDSIPARLSDGEYVIRAQAVQQLGVGYLNRLNAGKPAGYATGGYVGPTVGVTSSGPVDLSPASVRAIVAAMPKYTVLAATDQQLATSVAAGNRSLANQGKQF